MAQKLSKKQVWVLFVVGVLTIAFLAARECSGPSAQDGAEQGAEQDRHAKQEFAKRKREAWAEAKQYVQDKLGLAGGFKKKAVERQEGGHYYVDGSVEPPLDSWEVLPTNFTAALKRIGAGTWQRVFLEIWKGESGDFAESYQSWKGERQIIKDGKRIGDATAED